LTYQGKSLVDQANNVIDHAHNQVNLANQPDDTINKHIRDQVVCFSDHLMAIYRLHDLNVQSNH